MSFHRHLLAQQRGISALLAFVLRGPGKGLVQLPGPMLAETVAAPSLALVSDFIRFCGGDLAHHRGTLPPHLFPQWSLPAMLECARDLPYPPVKVINAGFDLEVLGPLLAARRLRVSSRVLSLDETERSARITIRVDTAPIDEPVALRADLHVLVRRSSKGLSSPKAPRDEPELIPERARHLATRRLGPRAGLQFAELTGDFNPIHWVGAYARAMRFANVILHGFGTAAIAFEALGGALLSGDFRRIRTFSAKFTKPLVLPARVGVFAAPLAGRVPVWVGGARGGPPVLVGLCELRD